MDTDGAIEKTKALARVQKFTPALLSKLSEIIIPPEFRGTTDAGVVQRAQRAYENAEQTGDTLSELHDKYTNCLMKIVSEKKPLNEDGQMTQIVPLADNRSLAVLHRSMLEEYRAKTGLNKLREQLKKILIEQISFEKGLENLLQHADDHRGFLPQPKFKVADHLKDLDLSPEAKKLNTHYPDITAEEIAWLSIADLDSPRWHYNAIPPVYYPPALIDMDFDGLKFAFGTIDERVEDNINATNHFKIGGLTGASYQYKLVPFNHNVSQVIRALVLLSLDDVDLFKRIWEEQDSAAFGRGDAMLLKSFLKKKKTCDLSQSLENLLTERILTPADISSTRQDITEYYLGLNIDQPDYGNIKDFVKLMGMLSRLPNFVEKEQKFNGYVKAYGTSIEFITVDGRIEDSVPLCEHLLHNVSYQFQAHVTDISKQNTVMEEVFGLLKKRVDQKVAGKHHMAIDAAQNQIFEKYGIFVPTNVYTRSRKFHPLEMVVRRSSNKEFVEHTVKFSFDELQMIEQLLENLPEGSTRHVRSIFKEQGSAETIYTIRTGTVEAGHYDPKTKQIVIGLPIESPYAISELELLGMMVMSSKPNRKRFNRITHDVHMHTSYFQHVVLHEIGESIWAHLDEDIRKKWKAIAATSDPKDPRSSFLTPYAKTSVSEDFCDTFAIYYTHGGEFRQRMAKRPVLAEKYAFMQQLWSGDGKQREFHDSARTSLSALHGKPEYDMQKLSLEEQLHDALNAQKNAIINERVVFADKALSYDEIRDMAVRDETSIQHAAETHREQDDIHEYREELEAKARVSYLVTTKTDEALCKLKVDVGASAGDLCKLLYHSQRPEAIDWIVKQGGKRKKAEKAVDSLLKLYHQFEDYLEHFGEDDKELGEETGKMMSGIFEWEAKQAQLKDYLSKRKGTIPPAISDH